MSSRHSFLIVAALLACVPAVQAVRPAATEAPKVEAKPEPPKPTEPVPPYVLKNKSSFANPVDITRAPFWPIGWVKRGKVNSATTVQQVEAPKVDVDPSQFRVTSILLGTGATASLAVINGRAYSEGEFLRMPRNGSTPGPRIRVQRITDGNIILQNGTQTMTVPLHRPELSSPKPEPLLNDQDR